MFERNQNQVGNITGDYNKVIQIILQDGKEVAENLGVLIDRLLNQEKEEIETLKKRITDKEEAIKDKTKIVGLQDGEILRLKTTLSEKEHQLEASEARFAKTFLENNGKDYTGSKELYPKALQLLTEGKKTEALAVLNRYELLEEKQKMDKEKEQQAASWLLRADLLKEEEKWGLELNECFDFAADIFSNWDNNLSAANHYAFINSFQVARRYYQICLIKAESDENRATTLNNLAVLQSDQNEYGAAEQSYEAALEVRRKLAEVNPQKYLPYVADTLNNLGNLQLAKNEYGAAEQTYEAALEIYRKLAEVNPQTYLPDVGMTLNNLGNLQRAKNEYGAAEQSYEEALEIRVPFAKLIPEAFEIPLADTYLCLSILYRYNIINEELSKEYAQQAVSLYQRYWNFVPHAKKWGEVAKGNLNDLE